MPHLLKQFVLDAHDILETMSNALLVLEKTPGDEAMVDELFRAAHTLKGNSGLFDMPTFTRVVHAAEDLLDKVRDKELSIDNDMTDDLLDSMDFIQRMVERIEATGSIPADFADEAEARIERLRARLPEPSDTELAEPAEHPDQVKPPEDLSWLAQLDEEERKAAYEGAAGKDLVGLRYIPEPDCFFKGEDPLLFLRNLPRRAGFRLRLLEAYDPAGTIDVYRANLEIAAISTAGRDELADYFRYVPEQVALYAVPPAALAIPAGEDGGDGSLRDAFVAEAETLLRNGDVAALADAAAAMLDMLNPALKTASGLRWIRTLALAGESAATISRLVRAIETGDLPVFDREPPHPSVSSGEPVPAPAAPSPSSAPQATAAPRPAASGKPNSFGRLHDILATQRQLLDLPVPDEQWEGRLNAIGNTLLSLLRAQGRPETVAAIEAVISGCLADRSYVQLAFHLDELLADIEENEATASPPESGIEPAAAPAPPQTAAAEPANPAEPSGGDAGRGGEPGDRTNRVLRVPQEKVDRLMDLIGEMVVAKNALPYLAQRAEEVYGSRELAREIKAQFAVINRIAEDMQDGIMQVRMLPVGTVFQRFSRLVRDTSRQLGKKVRLVLEGEDAEADKHIVESLGDPLIHIIRNSLDHGLELPEARRAAGKPEEGRILVRATQEGDRVLIEIEDDGRGIDPAIIKRKAFEKGLIDEARLEQISDADAIQLVFAPGFSTAETISNLSGRGVGMDVVRASLEKIGGQVRLSSDKGRGTRILLTLPLSVAVSHVLMVKVDGQRFGVPMDMVEETVRVPRSEIHMIKDRRVAVLRGRIVPLFGANDLLQLDNEPLPNADDEFAVLVARVEGATVGMIVDGFAQTTDVILKPLDGPLAALPGFAGSALLGDGSVLLVLDLKELMHDA